MMAYGMPGSTADTAAKRISWIASTLDEQANEPEADGEVHDQWRLPAALVPHPEAKQDDETPFTD